ncbi:hypothetical protein BJY52DRAFT_757459 [Lactarius psammicola]|nr:hypothetical protein BJY52DRAFT_757459 [Lactarius psammicola]
MPGSAVVDLRNSYGAAFIGLLVSTTLLGLMIVQAWIYYWHYWNKDRKALKFFIGFLVVMEVLHTIICAYAIYWYLVLNFGNLENMAYNMWALNIQTIISSIPGSSVQFYYARRVHIVSGSIFFPVVIVALVISGNAFAIYFTVKEFAERQSSGLNHLRSLVIVEMCSTVVVDILVAGTLCWSLYRKRTGFARTDSVIMTLMAYTINSGLLTGLLGTGMTISFIVAPSSMISLAFFLAMSKCYGNSLLAMLNSRDYVRDRSTTDHPDNAYNLSSIRIEPPSETYGSKPRRTGVSVTVHRSTASEFARSKPDHNLGPTLGVPTPDTSVIISQSQSRTSESSA